MKLLDLRPKRKKLEGKRWRVASTLLVIPEAISWSTSPQVGESM